ncbi:MAG: UDP-N-acetylmuramate--L-alanine ligase [Burkholderiaceae bacterium]
MKHRIKRVHFTGIGGAGMSGIAEVLLNLDYQVSGSDLSESAITERLAGLGAKIHRGHDAANIEGADCVVTSSAVRSDNPEVVAARASRIPVIARAVMLAELMKLKHGVAIAGTHGKTTTTSLTATVLAQGGLDPTFVIGGRLISAGANARLGAGDLIVVEADESDGSFLNLSPMMVVITNIDSDHMETYGHDLARLKQTFIEFVQRLPFYGLAVVCSDDRNVRDILPLISQPVLKVGLDRNADLRAVDIRADGAHMRFTVERAGREPFEVRLAAPGLHNVRNALAAIAIGQEMGVPDPAIATALEHFRGVGRRFQNYGELPIPSGGTFTLIDDYGHHPAEINATLQAARGAFVGRRLVVAFQPHRFTRTRDLFADFVDVLGQADVVLLADVYAAGETPIAGADADSLARAIRAAGGREPVRVRQIGDLPRAVLGVVRDEDVVLTLGAGSIGASAPMLRELANG